MRRTPKRLGRERGRTNTSLRAERRATDRSLKERQAKVEHGGDETRLKIRKAADEAKMRSRAAADRKTSRRSPTGPRSSKLDAERRRVAKALGLERKRSDRDAARERRQSDAALAKERRRSLLTGMQLFERERDRTDRDLGQERNRTDSAIRRIEGRLSKAAEARKQAAEEVLRRDELLAIVSHDLRTPLNTIVLVAARLGQLPSSEKVPEVREIHVRIETSVQRMKQMVEQLLDVQRISLGGLRLTTRSGDLREELRETVHALQPLFLSKGLSLEADLPNEPVVATYDRDRILQAFSNLLENAMKFTPEGGKIAVRMIAGDSRATVRVTDTGPGIPDDQQAKIFEAFSQLGPGRRGVGLGLAITKRIIDAHGGRVGVESRPGEGSTFFFSLPIERR